MKTKSMNIIDGELALGNFKLSSLASVYKTPLYVYDEAQIRAKVAVFKQYFKSEYFTTDIVYASKAFLAPYICSLMAELDCSMDSVSLGDLYLMKKAQYPMDRIYLHGNNKTRDELIFALNHQIGYIIVDNYHELVLLEELAQETKREIKILLRVNPGIEAHTHEYIQTAKIDSKFGESIFDEATIVKFINLAQASAYIKMEGFHTHIGSNIYSEDAFLMAIASMVNFIKKIEKLTKFKTKALNLGGGFAIKYLDSDPEIDLPVLLEKMITKLNYHFKHDNLALERVMLEPGRSIVGDAGLSLYTASAVKKTFTGKQYVFVDGGMTDNIRPALYKAKYSVDIANRPHEEKTELVDVVGPCCESGDIIAEKIYLNPVKSGDNLVVYSTGAYGYSMASNYNGARKSSVIFVHDGDIKIAIHREGLEDLVKSHSFGEQRFFDIHSDLLYDLNKKALVGKNNHFRDFHVPQLLASGVKGGIWTMYSPDDFDLIAACERAISKIDINLLPGFNVIYGLEGLRNLEKVEDIERLYKMGFRHAMLTWNEENKYATGVAGPADHGLHAEGVKLIQKMVELGMLIDLSHLNEKSFFDVLKVTNKQIINSHGNVKSLCNHRRNITDEQMRALRAADGLMGLTLAKNFVSKNPEEQTLERFLDHIDYAVGIMDVDHVCFGFDFMDYLSDFANSNLAEVADATMVYRIAQGLKNRGYSDDDVDKICYRNFYSRYYDKIVLKGEK